MSKIVLEDFNEGDGYYKVNLAYLNKEQVEEIENLIEKWNPTDEDIKACIGMCLTDVNEQRFKDYGTNLRDCLAWLEKQGEKKHSLGERENAYLDFAQSAIEFCYENNPLRKELITWLNSFKEEPQGKSALEAINEEKVDNANKIEPKFKAGDVLHSSTHHLIWIYKDSEHYYACVNMNYVTENVATDGLIKIPNDACPATKEQREQLEKAMTDAGYIFDFEKKELKKIVAPKFKIGDTMRTLQEASNGITSGLPVIVSIDNEYYHCNNELIAIKNQDNYEYPPMNRRQNTAWSEEDKKTLERVIRCIENHDYMNVDDIHWLKSLKGRVQPHPKQKWSKDDKVMLDEIIDFFEDGTVKLQHDLSLYASWLKSIKDRCTWRPSDEQMKVFENFVRGIWESCYDSPYENNAKLLYSLLEQLKKLK